MSENIRRNQYRVYKTNSSNTGTALSVDYNSEKESVFLEFAKQKDEKSYDWQNKLTIKLSINEIAKINVFYINKLSEVNLFHDPAKGDYKSSFKNAVLKITKSTTGNSYMFRLNQQETDGKLNSITVNLNEEELYTLHLIFAKIIQNNYL